MALLSDVTLVSSDGKLFNVHEATLATSSGFFKLHKAILECETGAFLKAFADLPGSKEFPVDASAEQLTAALSCMYDTCSPPPITLDNVRGLVAFFSKYDIPTGISACDAFLAASIELDGASLAHWIVLADKHSLTCFLEKCVRYAAKHLAVVSKPETWMVHLHPATLAKLVSHHKLSILQ